MKIERFARVPVRAVVLESESSDLDVLHVTCQRLVDEVREAAVLANADGWQTGVFSSPRLEQNLGDFTINVTVCQEMYR